MPSERVQRQIDRLLDEAEQAIRAEDWQTVQARCRAALALDAENSDARGYAAIAERELTSAAPDTPRTVAAPPAAPRLPTSFVNSRFVVQALLGEGGRKVVYRAHDTRLDRDVAFALIKTDGLDAAERERVQREARTLGRLSGHPNVVTVFEIGDDGAQPFLVSELLSGGDLAAAISAAPDHRLPLERVVALATGICTGLEYAHEQGLVHRDLKPGNVWLTAAGEAKIGDFGLAMGDGGGRLTQHGMMLGTALYMAPEQAMGGATTARSDLYSLGCVLYELVTGRPPFVGDGNVAIIGQHVNANPVAPSWHRPECPTALEALILRLLEKNPAQRPATATDVLTTLAALNVGPARTPSQPEASSAPPSGGANPVYQRAFVGRETELHQLEALFDAAVSGQGGLVMVVGEPGIGKTTLTEQLSTYAALRGGRTLVGHCYEEGSLSLPYLPFVEALRSYVLEREPEQLRRDLGSTAPDVARIVSEIRERVQVSPSAPSADPGEDRYRLLNAVGSFLHNAAAVQPLLIVLEDLHDADRGTLDLLQALARQLAGARLLVVGTYRDIEVDRQHPLSAALAELRRGARFNRVVLRGLQVEEVQRMLSAIAGQDVPLALAEAVHRQTEGNPLFVQEVIRYLAEEQLITREGGRWSTAAGVSLLQSIPEGLREVIGRRLSRLSDACNRLLAIASVIGREFDLLTLVSVSGAEEDSVSELLEEAVKVAVLSEQARRGTVQYRFNHAFFQQTLYEELSAARRIRLHQQVAQALERQYGERLEEHAAELAEHFAHSSSTDDLAKAVAYARLAATRASAVYAFDDAVHRLRQALEVQEVLDPHADRTKCELLIALGQALLSTTTPLEAAEEIAPRAFTHAERLNDDALRVEAALLAMAAYGRYAAGNMLAMPAFRTWLKRLEALALPGTHARAVADTYLFLIQSDGGQITQGWETGQRALAASRSLNDSALLGWVVGHLLNWPGGARHYRERLALADEFGDDPAFAEGSVTSSSADGTRYHGLAANLRISWGQRDRWEALGQRLLASLERSRSASVPAWRAMHASSVALLDGDLAGAVEQAKLYKTCTEEIGHQATGTFIYSYIGSRPLLELGRFEELLQVRQFGSWRRLVVLARTARVNEARAALRQDSEIRAAIEGRVEARATQLCDLLEAAVVVEDREVAAALIEQLEPTADLLSSYMPDSCPGRHLGAAARLLGNREQARAFYDRALAVATRARFRPEIALIRLQMAELAADGDASEQQEAVAHLAFVLPELEAMAMRPALERAQALRDRLHDAAGPSPDPESAAEGSPAPVAAASTAARPVFISYASADRARAVDLAGLLEAAGEMVWLDRRSIAGGASWDEEIVNGIRGCGVLALLCSPAAMASPNVQQELRLALQYRKPILPLKLAEAEFPAGMEYILAGRQWVEMLDQPQDAWLPRVLHALERLT